MLEDLCFFSSNRYKGISYEDGGINQFGHNGYVKDCTSLGPDVISQGAVRLMPKAVAAKNGKKGAALKATPAQPAVHAQLYSTNFYKTLA
mmetsp:Transcript_58001/g.152497  ORF Transcript_58001/g.152497 Transcript_58001/m.152497 type:complete len:90 (-) Transcript_58001:35-304(-)